MPQTLALVRKRSASTPLARIVSTPLHSDDCGVHHELQEVFGCQIKLPQGQGAKVDRGKDSTQTYRDTGQQCPRFRRTGAVYSGGQIQ